MATTNMLEIEELNRVRDLASGDINGGDGRGIERARIYMRWDLQEARAIREGMTIAEFLTAEHQLRCEYFALLRPPEQVMKNYYRRSLPTKKELEEFGSLRVRGLEHTKPDWWNLSYEPDRYEVAPHIVTDIGIVERGRRGLRLRVAKS